MPKIETILTVYTPETCHPAMAIFPIIVEPNGLVIGTTICKSPIKGNGMGINSPLLNTFNATYHACYNNS